MRVVRSPAAFFSGAVVEDGVAGLAVVPRGRFVVVAVAELRVVVVMVVLVLLASAMGELLILLMSLQLLILLLLVKRYSPFKYN